MLLWNRKIVSSSSNYGQKSFFGREFLMSMLVSNDLSIEKSYLASISLKKAGNKIWSSKKTGVNILSHDPLGASFQQKKNESKLVHKQKS